LAQQDGIDVKPTLLRVLTDFYVQKPAHTAEEEQHFSTLALRLIEEVDHQTRATVAQKLAAYGAAPTPVLAKLGALNPPAGRPDQPRRPLVSDHDKAAAARFSDIFFHANAEERRAILRELDSAASAPPLAIPPDDAALARQRLEVAALRGRP